MLRKEAKWTRTPFLSMLLWDKWRPAESRVALWRLCGRRGERRRTHGCRGEWSTA
jgi:hypothetical protein